MKITFPPDDISECGGWRNSRQYEALPQVFPLVTYLILLWCVVNHLVGYTQSNGDSDTFLAIQRQFGAMNVLNPWGEPVWKFLSACFIHDHQGILHVLFNMMWLFTLGPLMERGLGSLKFLLFVIVTGFCSSVLQTVFDGAGIGFSGVVYAMVGFMWAAWPRWTGFLEKFRGSTVKFLLFWQVICFLVPIMNVGNIAHISGLAIGGMIGLWACWGNKIGFKWLLASIATIAVSITLAFWAPFNGLYQLHALSEKENPTLEELFLIKEWKSYW